MQTWIKNQKSFIVRYSETRTHPLEFYDVRMIQLPQVDDVGVLEFGHLLDSHEGAVQVPGKHRSLAARAYELQVGDFFERDFPIV